MPRRNKERLFLRSRFNIIIYCSGLHAIAVYRFGNYIDLLSVKPILLFVKYIALAFYYFLNFFIIMLYGIHIDKKASIGPGLYIGHFGGIFIEQCHIGKNCSIHQQVRIDQTATSGKNAVPTCIGNNVWIGCHSKIKGGVTVEDNATIAAGSMVKANVKKGALVMGAPARVIKPNYNNELLLGVKKLEVV